MKNFELFVNDIISQWRKEKNIILESAGLKGPSNREKGDLAEEYVIRRINKLTPTYNAIKSTGSQTPADIYAVARRNGYWHIMLIQVKSSTNKNNIYKLNENDKKVLNELGKFINKQIVVSEHMINYRKSKILISTGHVDVYRNEKTLRHSLVNAKGFKVFKRNASTLDMEKIRGIIALSHKL
ncbi:hypothetical protein [Zunongwangia profunda]|uniref:hypothetical protein n=1 Tax=Zunongwangia profunda TaxID=398743 RepID=UPI0030DBA1E0|tara:strand:+ start:226 stop:774 length:549 start_codon:yes stop_codon:yes gene_type:complete